MKKTIFPKRNELVSLKGNNLSLYARKTLDYIYKEGLRIYSLDRKAGIFELDINLLKKEIGMNRTSDYSQVKEEMEKINKLEFETYDAKHYSKFPLLAGFNITDNGILEVALSPFLIRMIFDDEKPYYHLVDFMDSKPLRSKYSKIILDLYNRYKPIEIPKFQIEKFRDLTGYPETYRNNDIQKFVLEQAQKELEKHNNLNLTWKIEKLGRKWHYIKLFVSEIIIEEVAAYKYSEKLISAIKKSQQNQYIKDKFSDKAMQIICSKYDEIDIIKALYNSHSYNQKITNFSSFLTSAIEDIKNSKMSAIIEKNSDTNAQVKVSNTVTSDYIEPILSSFEDLKAKITGIGIKKFLDERNLQNGMKFCDKVQKSNSEEELREICDEYGVEHSSQRVELSKIDSTEPNLTDFDKLKELKDYLLQVSIDKNLTDKESNEKYPSSRFSFELDRATSEEEMKIICEKFKVKFVSRAEKLKKEQREEKKYQLFLEKHSLEDTDKSRIRYKYFIKK